MISSGLFRPDVMRADEQTDLRLVLSRAIDGARNEGRPFSLERAVEAVRDGGIALDWRSALAIGELAGFRGEHSISTHVVEFVCAYAEKLRPSRLLDPFATSPALLAAVVERVAPNIAVGVTPSQAVHTLALATAPNATWVAEDPWKAMEQNADRFDFVVSAPPFGLRRAGVRGDAILDLLERAASLLSDGGQMLVLLPEGVNVKQDGVRFRARLAELGIGVERLVAVAEPGTASSVPMQLVGIGEAAHDDEVFVGRLTPQTDSSMIARAIFDRLSGPIEDVGRWVRRDRYTTWQQFASVSELHRLLGKTRYPPRRLADIATEIRRIELREGVEFQIAGNAVYIPEIRGTPTLRPTSEGAKRRSYLEIVLDPEQVSPDYLVGWMESPLGRLARDSAVTGTTIPRLSVPSAREMLVVVPAIGDQLEALEADNALRTLSLQATELRSRLWRNPDQAGVIRADFETLTSRPHQDGWLENLPFPLASIAYRATADAASDDKISRLLHFFEATAEFVSTVLLSGLRSNPELYEGERSRLVRGSNDGTSTLDRSTFGSWTQLGQTLAKSIRRLLGSTETRDATVAMFAVRDERVVRNLAGKELWHVLDEARSLRNARVHGGIAGSAEKARQMERLTGLQLALREASEEMFSQLELVQPGEMTLSQGVYRHTVRRLTGPNPIFRLREIEASIPLDASYLYLVGVDSFIANALQLVPLFRLLAPPDSEQSAVYFYNSRSSDGSLRFVSYHFEGQPEAPVSDPGLSQILDELSAEP